MIIKQTIMYVCLNGCFPASCQSSSFTWSDKEPLENVAEVFYGPDVLRVSQLVGV